MEKYILVSIVCGKVKQVTQGITNLETFKELAIEAMTNGFYIDSELFIAESVQMRIENNDGTTKLETTLYDVTEIKNWIQYNEMDISIHQNEKHVKHMTVSNITEAFTWLKENYGTNTAMIKHHEENKLFQEHWIVQIKQNVFTIVNLSS